MGRAKLYAFTAPETMPEPVFVDVLTAIAQSTHEHLFDLDLRDEALRNYSAGAYESAAFTISCMIAQRYGLAVSTADVVDGLDLATDDQTNAARRKSVEILISNLKFRENPDES